MVHRKEQKALKKKEKYMWSLGGNKIVINYFASYSKAKETILLKQ